jgi:hypothetical protein
MDDVRNEWNDIPENERVVIKNFFGYKSTIIAVQDILETKRFLQKLTKQQDRLIF